MSTWRPLVLSDVLRMLADSSMIPIDADGAALHCAAEVLDRVLTNRPTVLITGGHNADPVTLAVECFGDDIDRISDEVSTFGDRIDELKRLLKAAAKQEATS